MKVIGLSLAVILAAGLGVEVAAQRSQRSYDAGQEVVPAYEGWERNRDGSFNLVFGTMNRNWKEELHIPVGPHNHIEPGGPDQGQPTYFLPRRNRFLFRVHVPADFGDKELVWTLTSPNGETKRAYGTLKPDYFIDNSVIIANNGAGIIGQLHKNVPPALTLQGAATRSATVGNPVTLTAVARDPDGLPNPKPRRRSPTGAGAPVAATGLRFSWFLYRGTGGVVFDPPQIKVWEDTREDSNSPWGPGWVTPEPPPDNTWIVRATFSAPGTYVLRAQAHDGGLSTTEDVTFVVTGASRAGPRIPAVTPVPTTVDSVPYGSDDADVASLGAFGYVQEEFFISGTVGGLPYATRILVRRPADPGRFSGIVLAESIRSTAHRSMWSIRDYLMRSGHAYVELGSNRQGILNLVKPSNPSRYAALAMPDVDPDARVFGHLQEIIAQGGMLLKSNLPAGPFAGFEVRRIILGGCSEQGVIVRVYMRDSHWQYRTAEGDPIYDGYFPACVADWPDAVRFDSGRIIENFASPAVDVPVVHLTGQQEVESWPESGRRYRRPDSDAPSDLYRLYEVAGMPHGFFRSMSGTACGDQQASDFPGNHVANNALDKLIAWVDQGVLPPRAERLATAGASGAIELDADGNAIGGVRTTYVDVPVATYHTCMLSGYKVPFSHERLAEVYGSPEEYVTRVDQRRDELTRDGWYLEEDAEEIRKEAAMVASEWSRDGAF